MKSGSDRIVLALVVVLAIIVTGVVVTIIIEALNPAELSEIGQQVAVFFATVGGAIVGVAGGYVTHTAPIKVGVADAVPEPTPADGATPGGDGQADDGQGAAAPEVAAPVVADQEPVAAPEPVNPAISATENLPDQYGPEAYDDVTSQFVGGSHA